MTAALNISETGRRAFLAGLGASENPFKIGSQARSLWAKGYREARASQTRDSNVACEGSLQNVDPLEEIDFDLPPRNMANDLRDARKAERAELARLDAIVARRCRSKRSA